MGNNEFIDTEPCFLFKGANRDIINIRSSLRDIETPIEEKSDHICFNASRAAEKMLKGYIRHTDKTIGLRPLHNLDNLYNLAFGLNKSFLILHNDVDTLDTYKSWTGYESIFPIKKQEVIDVLQALNNVYEFPEIKYARDKSNEAYYFNTLDDNCVNMLVNMLSNGNTQINNIPDNVENISCFKHDLFSEISMFSQSGVKNIINNIEEVEEYMRTGKNGKEEKCEKLKYNNEDNIVYVLQRTQYLKNNKFQSEAFHFKENFNRQSANEFLKQFDNIKINKKKTIKRI